MDGRLNAYRKEDTAGKSQIDLILQVYDGAIAAFRTASEHYADERADQGFEELERARRFVTHLYTTLDHDKGGEIADRLSRLYAWVINQVNVAQATKDLTVIDDNITILNNLRDGWRGVKEQQQQQRTPNPMPEPAEAATTGFTHSA